jgi:hypothetical protein
MSAFCLMYVDSSLTFVSVLFLFHFCFVSVLFLFCFCQFIVDPA